ncbi:MAG: AAA family ATPase [Myxococcota bacterium]
MGGRVASGKSHLARALAERLGAEHVEADALRGRLAGRSDSPEARLASMAPLASTEVYAELRRATERALASHARVVADACFPHRTQREALRALARRLGATFLFVECRVDADVLRKRLEERDAAAGRPGWAGISDRLARAWEDVEAGELPAAQHRVVDTGGPVEAAVAAVVERLVELGAWPAPGEAERAPLRAVTFDCWNTLVFEPSWQIAHARRVDALAEAAAEAGRHVSTAEAGHAFDDAWERHMRLWREGVASGAKEVARWALAELGLRDPHPALEDLTRHFEEASHSGKVEALPGARDTLEALARAGVRRALVCDTGLTPGRVVRRHLDRLGLLEWLEVTIFSDEVGVPKPDARAFLAALEPLGVAPGQALHVGDLRRTDVAGARAVGMETARLRARHDDTSELPEADHVVASHADLLVLVAKRATTP